MARAPDKRIEQAKAMYLEGKKLVEIASQLNLPEGTVRRWKCTHKWDSERSENKSERSEKEEVIAHEVKQVVDNRELTDEQQLFCVLYVKCFNATKAYQKAYGCNYISAKSNGHRLLTIDCIKEEINKLKQNRLNREFLDEHDIFQKYMDIAFADITDYVEFGQEEVNVMGMYGPVQIKDEETGEKVPLMQKVNTVRFKDSSNVDGTIISEIKHGRNGTSIKLADRMKALQWLSDHMDLATDEQKARIGQIKAQTERLQVVEKETDEAVEKLDQILKEVRDNAIKQETE